MWVSHLGNPHNNVAACRLSLKIPQLEAPSFIIIFDKTWRYLYECHEVFSNDPTGIGSAKRQRRLRGDCRLLAAEDRQTGECTSPGVEEESYLRFYLDSCQRAAIHHITDFIVFHRDGLEVVPPVIALIRALMSRGAGRNGHNVRDVFRISRKSNGHDLNI